MKVLRGISAAPGLAIGTALTIRPMPPVDLTEQRSMEAPAEVDRLTQAIEQAILLLEKLQATANGTLAEILAAQREMLDDPELKQGALDLIASGSSATAAISRVAAAYADQLAKRPDPCLAARAEDVREAGRRIVTELRGTSSEI